MLAAIGPRRLLGIAAPMALWALHFVTVYSLAGLACARGWDRRAALGLPLVSWWMLLATVLALLLIALLGLRAHRRWRRAIAAAPAASSVDADADVARRHRFSAAATALVALLAAVAVLFTAVPVALLPLCAGPG
ncbi:hypothetical protein [Arenimonas composti]|uniref:Uncharacterized protein n=1 Tax=Arenimonas composti TR7-09 = DSM 18010 TaxID=1121013 RepID=A0A091AYA7_9GAMM|nr:hypothetical protein [Arenimonas composti]KFN45303.1 hypothetical protein P873_02450 [Arenimonas composti TR7-09 = DSM 18010]